MDHKNLKPNEPKIETLLNSQNKHPVSAVKTEQKRLLEKFKGFFLKFKSLKVLQNKKNNPLPTPSDNFEEFNMARFTLIRENMHNRHESNNYSVGTLKNYLKLLENELNPNEYEFVKPTCFGNLKLRRLLVPNCDTIDAKDNQGRTALSKAVICNNLTV